MDEKPLTKVDAGIPNASLADRHVYGYYHLLDEILAYLSRTDGALDGKKLKMMVRFAISTLPDVDQSNRCAELLEKITQEELQELITTRNHPTPTQEDVHDAMISASMTTLQMLQQIMDKRYGIQYQNEFGEA